ncbi:hypothetical protein, partial [Mycolicibacterium insubricum]|uniref:hypothetical protein n=1 Tax=Mycolicibacterium insubricum TaxID=444597 RepID=UPI0021F2E302
ALAPVGEQTGYRRWSQLLHERARTLDTCEFWETQLRGPDPVLRCAPGTAGHRPGRRPADLGVDQ